jgi:7,8-dihydroneopterin aldolase/epimerase/oxygenase
VDQILLEGMTFYGYHGVNPEERVLGQRFVVDLVASADLTRAGQTDHLDETVSYSTIYQRVRVLVEGDPFALLEALGNAIATTILAEFPAFTAIDVTVRKPGVAIEGSILSSAGVRIRRERAGVAT